jgi:hypothetical protein
MAIMDIVSGNEDRNEANTLMVRNHNLEGVDAPAETWTPVPIDHTETVVNYGGGLPIQDYIATSQGDSMDWMAGLFDKVGPVTFKMMMDKRAQIALDNLRQQYGPYMNQDAYELFAERLQGIMDLSANDWETLIEKRG